MSLENEQWDSHTGVGKAAWAKRQLIQGDYPQNLYSVAYGDSETVLNNHQLQGVLIALCFLKQQHRDILEMRYRDKMTLSEISKCFGVIPERIRQIESQALRKLRYPNLHQFVKYGFEDYLNIVRQNNQEIGYNVGFNAGYDQGVKDAGEGVLKIGVSVRIVDLPVEALCLSPTTVRTLRDYGIEKISDLLKIGKKEIPKIPHLLTKRRAEIAAGLRRYQIRDTAWNDYYNK